MAIEPTRKQQHILILGGGFAGMYAALRLERKLARDPNVQITLVNRDNFFLFTPMLHEVATSDLDPTHIVNPIRKLLKRVHFFAGEAEAIDLPGRRVRVSHGAEHHHHELSYDHLVIALGSVTNFFNLPGLRERAFTMKSLGDAIAVRNHAIQCLEEADFECCPQVREPLLTLVVAGGGFAGVETAGGLNDFMRQSIRFYPHLREDMLRIVLVHAGPVLLPELKEKLAIYAQKKLSRRKVEVLVHTRIQEVSEGMVCLSTGERIKTNTLIWTAGTTPNPLLAQLPCRREGGRICVNEHFEVPEWPGVWAVGDCAFIRDSRKGTVYPPTAQHAVREGRVLAYNLRAAVYGRAKRPFVFSTLGQLATIGRRTGVANLVGINFSGIVAWWLWRTIYLSKLPRLEKKLRVALDWTLDLLFSKDLVQYLTKRGSAPSNSEDRPAFAVTSMKPFDATPAMVATGYGRSAAAG
jgi:NADH dehydrogenase